MTALVELERIARAQIPPVGATAAIATAEVTPCGRLPKPLDTYPNGIGGTTSFGVAWLVDGRIRTRPFVTFERGRDARRLVRLLNGTEPSAPRGPLATTTSVVRQAVPDPAGPEASLAFGVSLLSAAGGHDEVPSSDVVEPRPAPRACAGCGGPLPEGSRAQRATCSDACRADVSRRRRATEAARAASDTGAPVVTVSRPSDAPDHRHIDLPNIEEALGGGWQLSGIEWLAVEAQAGKPAWLARGWKPHAVDRFFEQVLGETPTAAYLALRTAIERRS